MGHALWNQIKKSKTFLSPDRPRAKLISFKPGWQNTPRGFADIEFPSGPQHLGIVIGVADNGKPSPPGRPIVGTDGQTLSRDSSGKINYARIVKWRDAGLHKHFHNVALKLVRGAHPDVFGGRHET